MAMMLLNSLNLVWASDDEHGENGESESDDPIARAADVRLVITSDEANALIALLRSFERIIRAMGQPKSQDEDH